MPEIDCDGNSIELKKSEGNQSTDREKMASLRLSRKLIEKLRAEFEPKFRGLRIKPIPLPELVNLTLSEYFNLVERLVKQEKEIKRFQSVETRQKEILTMLEGIKREVERRGENK